MDSFFGLFDPSDGQSKPSSKKTNKAPDATQDNKKNKVSDATQDNNKKNKVSDATQDSVKKKPVDTPKANGSRRGRRSQGKGSPLPEESSFLCQPPQPNGAMVAGSYIENYMELNVADPKTEADKRPKRRNSVRKSRRRKAKPSPPKELLPWPCDDGRTSEDVAWNNTSYHVKPKNSCESVGKNVNNLRGSVAGDYLPRTRSITEPLALRDAYCGDELHNEVQTTVEHLKQVSVKDDSQSGGAFDHADLADDVGGDYSDSTSDMEDTSDETYGSLPPEPRYGNVEYKLQLVSPCEKRLQHLVTQLKWRLRSGGGAATYVVGVRDCGALVGLRARALRASLRTLARMADALDAHIAHVSVKALAPQRAVAEVYVRKLAETQQSVELRVAVMGANEAGKSTLIGVLTQGELDNGRGSARLNMFRHVHEVRSGRTSSLSHEILGFDAQGNVVNYGCSELMTAERIGERSSKLVSFLDLAGHSKYQRTTVHGLSGYSPHYAMLVVSATAGITHITEEHIGLLLALDLPFFTVISKCELEQYGGLLDELGAILRRSNKKPLLITDEHLARNCVAPQRLILDSVDTGVETHDTSEDTDESSLEPIPVFPVSCVKGIGLNALHAYLLALAPPAGHAQHTPEEESCEFQIDEIFHVGDSAGPVVGGLLARGRLYEGDNLLIGPLDDGSFAPISVSTIYRNRVPCDTVRAGHCASLGLSHYPPNLRQGMVLLAIPEHYNNNPKQRPTFGTCSGKCKNTPTDHHSVKTQKKNKNERRKDKNLLKDIQIVENSLKKASSGSESNIFKPEAGKADRCTLKEDKCTCADEVYLDDPNDPRGCLYFQATVELLRHSSEYISPGFQCTVHIGNVRQTAIIEGILSPRSQLSIGARASVVFRFGRWPEYVRARRRILLRAGGTTGIGLVVQVFPHIAST